MDRISEKLLRLMGQCLRDTAFCEAQLATEDAVAISCALWAKGFYNAKDAIDAVLRLISDGTKHQKMTASYFIRSLEGEKEKLRATKDVILRGAQDPELAACFLPGFLESVHMHFYNLVRESG